MDWMSRQMALFVIGLTSDVCLAGGIIPDGTTQTTVAIRANGKQEVKVATPVASGVSYNAYSSFNIDRNGAEFNNSAGARVIVNEVTSTNPSYIQGTLSVTGARANVVIANPNGLSINGAKFDNMGSLVLSTGKISLKDYIPAPGMTQRNVTLDTRKGVLEVGPEGMSGAFNTLELIAKEIRINGSVTNTYSSDKSKLHLVAGDSSLEMDTSISPVDENSPWIYWGPSGATTQDGRVLINITSAGSLTAGRIELAVTDKGAGVCYAGSGLAAQGDFTISASGKLQIIGADLGAQGSMVLNGAATEVTNSKISSVSGLQVISSEIALHGAKLSAGTAAVVGDVILGVDSSGNGFVFGADQNGSVTEIESTGGIGIFAADSALHIHGATLKSVGGMQIEAGQVNVTGVRATDGSWKQSTIDSGGNLLLLKQKLLNIDGSVVAANGDVEIKSEHLLIGSVRAGDDKWQSAKIESRGGALTAHVTGNVKVKGGSISGVKTVSINADSIEVDGNNGDAELRSDGGSITLESDKGISFASSLVVADQDVSLKANTISLDHNQASSPVSRIASVDGRIDLFARQDILNQSGVIQGARNTESGPAVSLRAGGNIHNLTIMAFGATPEDERDFGMEGGR